MKLSQLAQALNAEVLNFKNDFEISGFVIDSRKATKDSLFVPLKGTRDGHDFVEDAIKNGAGGYLTEKSLPFPNGVLVKDTYQALVQIGKHKRRQVDTVIGITGSSGKTSTKELLHFTLKHLFSTYATQGNLNNEIGVPLTLANIPAGTQVAVIEKGAAKKDDIAYLMEMSNPEIGVLTSLGEAHIERFGSFENIIHTKGQIFDGVRFGVLPSEIKHHYTHKNTRFITCGEDGEIKLSNIRVVEDGTEGEISYKSDRITLKIPIYNIGVFKNIGLVAGVLYALDLDPVKHLEVLRDFKGFDGRGDIKKAGRFLVIDESYNANPLSVKNSIHSFEKLSGYKVYVLGDMLELGQHSRELHLDVAKVFERSNIDLILLYGQETKHIYDYLKDKKPVFHYDDKQKIAGHINSLQQENIKITIKGSRSMKMEEIIPLLV